MNVITRGARNALRSPLRSGAIVVILAVSIGLILAMLVARSSVEAKIKEIKTTTATQITLRPAGFMGGLGGGDYLKAEQLTTIKNIPNIQSVVPSLVDRIQPKDTSLKPSFELGDIGTRMFRIQKNSSNGGSTQSDDTKPPSGESAPKLPEPETTLTGTTNPVSVIGNQPLTSGVTIDGNGTAYEALLGKKIAEKNNLKVGDTFTLYGKTVSIRGIFTSGNNFSDSGVVVPIATLQTLIAKPDVATEVDITANSSDNVASIVSELKNKLGDQVDVTSQQDQIEESVKPLESISQLALASVIGAAAAGAVIVLFAMVLIVRERRREIGVIKAIGGTNSKVMVQFVVEAITLTLIAGAIGFLLGIFISAPITKSLVSQPSSMPFEHSEIHSVSNVSPMSRISGSIGNNLHDITSTLTPEVFVMSFGIMLLIAILGSAVPAWLIARVRPAEVLRTE